MAGTATAMSMLMLTRCAMWGSDEPTHVPGYLTCGWSVSCAPCRAP